MQITFQHSIRGYLVGHIWAPGSECYKHLTYDLTREDARFTPSGTLRDHVLAATNDDDFQSCEIADGYLYTTATITRNGRTYRRERMTPLDACASISDMVKINWDGPTYDE